MIHRHPMSGRLTCSNCGTVYLVQKSRVAERNDGTIKCSSCGEPFIEWTGAVAYRAEIVTAAQAH